MTNTPVALFVYNRPKHTRLTVEALMKNKQAVNTDLFIFSDGPTQSNSDTSLVEKVRTYLTKIKGFNSVILKESTANQGLANSIISGVTELCNKYDKVIVLEDDIIVSPCFLSYMNRSLEIYQNNTKVMHISAYMFPVQYICNEEETFFYRATSCWGWATWKRAWRHFESDGNKLLANIKKDRRGKYQFNIHGSYNYYGMLENQIAGNVDSWAIRWYASVFLNNGLCLHPRKSLVNNIGHDGTGVHCSTGSRYDTSISHNDIKYYEQTVAESKCALLSIIKFYRPHNLLYNAIFSVISYLLSSMKLIRKRFNKDK